MVALRWSVTTLAALSLVPLVATTSDGVQVDDVRQIPLMKYAVGSGRAMGHVETHIVNLLDSELEEFGSGDDGGDDDEWPVPVTPPQFFEVLPPVFGHVHRKEKKGYFGRLLESFTSSFTSSQLKDTTCHGGKNSNGDCMSPDPSCSQVILRHSFSNSFNEPAVAKYISRCGALKYGTSRVEESKLDVENNEEVDAKYTAGSEMFSKIILRLDCTIEGRQFDRFAGIWLDGVEIWRLTSAEPTKDGIWWTSRIDVTKYRALFSPNRRTADGTRTLVMALDNLVNEVYTGTFHITLTLDFYEFDSTQQDEVKKIPAADDSPIGKELTDLDLKFNWRWPWPWTPPGEDNDPNRKLPATNLRRLDVIALSSSNTSYGWFKIPNSEDVSVASYKLTERDYKKILSEPFLETSLDIFVSPHGDDEFYYANPHPFREVRVYLDETLVGVFYPFPVVYTGGMNPLMWRPIAATGAYNIESYRFDITPFSQIIRERKVEKIRFSVCAGSDETHDCIPPKSFWLVDGTLSIRRFDIDRSGNKTDDDTIVKNVLISQVGDIQGKISGSKLVEKKSSLFHGADQDDDCESYSASADYQVETNFSILVEYINGTKLNIPYHSFTGGTLDYSGVVNPASLDASGNQDDGDLQDANYFSQVIDCSHSNGVGTIDSDSATSTEYKGVPTRFPEPHSTTNKLQDTFTGLISASVSSVKPTPTGDVLDSSSINGYHSRESNSDSEDFIQDEERIPLVLRTWIAHNTTREQKADGCVSPIADEFGIDAILLAGGNNDDIISRHCTSEISLTQQDKLNQISQGMFTIFVNKPSELKSLRLNSLGKLSLNSEYVTSDDEDLSNDPDYVKQGSFTRLQRSWDSDHVEGCWLRYVSSENGTVVEDVETLCHK